MNKYEESKTKINTTDNKDSIVVLCANVRTCNIKEDINQLNWYYRAPLFKKWLELANADIIGFQEVTKIQMEYLVSILSDYDFEMIYRDNKENSECCPVFYKKDRFEKIQKGNFWLSKTPSIMSKGWNAACYRICTYAILKDKNTNKELVVFNTHLDHISEEARINGIHLVLDRIKEFGFLDKTAILMGDMNDFVNTPTINALFADFEDSASIASNFTPEVRDHCTYQNFGRGLDEKRIDYFGVRHLNVLSYEVINKLYDTDEYKNIYPSDHFPIKIVCKYE